MKETKSLDHPNMKEWTAKRSRSYLAFCFIAICHGAEYSIVISSLWFYMDKIIQVKNPMLYYGLTLGLFYVSSIVGSFMISWYVDQSRNTRTTIICLLVVEILGNVLYSIDTSAYFPMVGRIIVGISDVNISIVVAELARSYPVEECTSKIANIVTCISFSIVFAPALSIVFKYIDFTVYGFHVSYGNFPGIFMALLNCTALSLAIVFVSDLSKEYDLKGDQAALELSRISKNVDKNEIGNEEDEDFSNDQSKSPLLSKQLHTPESKVNSEKSEANGNTPWQLFSSFDYVLLVVFGSTMSFNSVAFFDVAMPILASTHYGFNSQAVGALFCTTAFLFIMTVQGVKKLSKIFGEYILLLVGLGVFLAAITCLFFALMLKHGTLSLVLFITFVLLLGESWCVEQVFVRSMLAMMIPSEYQSFGEGVRKIGSSIGCVISSFVTRLIILWLPSFCIIVIITVCCFMVLLLIRHKTLRSIKR